MDRLVAHVDMDAFFVSVEELFDPSLAGKPVVVGGSSKQRGVVAAASYAARRYGVHSAMPLRQAVRLCPHAIFVKGNPDRYREYSRRIFAILQQFTPRVEMASVDEAYLDLTGTQRLHGPPLAVAHRVHERIGDQTRLRCSIGLAASRLVAKVASDQAKPNGVLWVLPSQEAAFLAPLAVRKIPGVGKVGEARLQSLGIHRVEDLRRLPPHVLTEHFGKWGLALAGKAEGSDRGGWFDKQIGESNQPKSISHENTFSTDLCEREPLEAALAKLCEMVAKRLRAHALYARTVHLKLRFSDFETITRARSRDHGTQTERELMTVVLSLFREAWDGRAPVRLLGVYAGSLSAAEGQLSLLEEPEKARLRRALEAVDRVRARFGESKIALARGMRAAIREKVHENPVDLPGKTGADAQKDE